MLFITHLFIQSLTYQCGVMDIYFILQIAYIVINYFITPIIPSLAIGSFSYWFMCSLRLSYYLIPQNVSASFCTFPAPALAQPVLPRSLVPFTEEGIQKSRSLSAGCPHCCGDITVSRPQSIEIHVSIQTNVYLSIYLSVMYLLKTISSSGNSKSQSISLHPKDHTSFLAMDPNEIEMSEMTSNSEPRW